MVKIKIMFLGEIARRAAIKECHMDVSTDLEFAVNEVREVVISRVGDNTLFSIIINGKSYALMKESISKIVDGDVFAIVPVILGG